MKHQRPEGFANPEVMITIFVVAVVLALVIPNVVRVVQRRNSVQLIATINAIKKSEDAWYEAHYPRYADSSAITPAHLENARIEQWRADSSGWGVIVVGDTGKAAGKRCAMFDGADVFRPDGHVGRARELACW